MELKISKIQWKKVLAFILTLCMTITMVQIPVNAEETTQPVNSPKHFDVRDLEDYEETATFFDAAEDRTAIDVQPMEENQTYTIDPTTGYYDAKWFSFTPSEDGMYYFRGENIENTEVDSYGCLMEKVRDQYQYIDKDDDANNNGQFGIKAVLERGKTYYLCAGYYKKGQEQYNVKVSKINVEDIEKDKNVTFSSKDTPRVYSFTPSDTGYYNIKYSWDSASWVSGDSNFKDKNGEEIDYIDYTWGNKSYAKKYLFQGGQTYYLSVNRFACYDDDDETIDDNITVSISEIPMETITEEQPGSIESNTEAKIFQVNVNSAGWYELKYSVDADIESNIFRLIDESGNYMSTLQGEYQKEYFVYLEKEKTYTLSQNSFTTDEDAKVSISITKIEQGDISISQTGTVASGEGYRIFKFIPDKSGYCKVESSWENEQAWSDGSIALYRYVEDDEDGAYYDEVDSRNLRDSLTFNAKEGQTYYLLVSNPRLFVNEDADGNYIDQTEVKGDISIKISSIEDTMDMITSQKPGQYVTNPSNSEGKKTFKYVAENTGYYKLSFDWDKNLTKNMDIHSSIRVESEDNTEYANVEKVKDIYMEKGQNYYINVDYINLNTKNGEEWPESTPDITFNINISQIPVEEIDYTKTGSMKSSSYDKIFKFTAQQNGYHVLACKWNDSNVKMATWGAEFTALNPDIYPSNSKIAKENGAYYRKFKCKKGETYLINLTAMTFKSLTANEDVDNVDVAVSVAYYNGKTDLGTIKNTQPWIPGKDNGETGKPNDGKNDNPGTDKKDDNTSIVKPAEIKVSSIKIAALSNKIAAGKKVKLAATIAPENASNKAVKWTTSNKKVAKVSQSGVVTVNKKAAGKSVVITAIAADGSGARATYKIKVMKDAVKRLTVKGKKVVKAGKKIKLKAKVAAGKKANKKLVWTSSNTKFATVNQKGIVKTTKAGKGKKVKITARTTDGSNKKKVFVIRIK